MSAFLIEPLGLMQPAYHNAAHLRFFLIQPANRHDVSAIKEFKILFLNIESLNIFHRWSTCSEDRRCANFWSILTRVWPLSGSNCPIYNAHLSPNSWCSPTQPAPPIAFPSSLSSNSTLSGIQTKSRITASVPQVICPNSFTKCCCLNLPATSRIWMCPHFSTATTIISHLSHCNRFLSASILVASTLVSVRWDPLPRKARACYSFAQKPTMSSNLTLSKSPSFSNSLWEPMCSGTNHPGPVPFPPHTPPTTLALWPLHLSGMLLTPDSVLAVPST